MPTFRKPLALSSAGYSQELPTSADIQLNIISALGYLQAPALDPASGDLAIGGQMGSGQTVKLGSATAGVSVLGTFSLDALGIGLVHADANGELSSSLLVNADVDANAAIAYSKLDLASSIVNGDVAANAAIAYSKLDLAASIVNADVASNAAIAGTKIAPNFGSQNVSTTGTLSTGNASVGTLSSSGLATLASLNVADLGAGVAHLDASGNMTSSQIVNADVSSSAAIAGTKISPDFGAQAVQTTGNLTAAAGTLSSLTVSGLNSAGVVHTDSSGAFTTSQIVNADVSSSAAIAYSKLALTGSIVNADVSATAAIAGTKISPNFGSQNVQTSGTLTSGAATVQSLSTSGNVTVSGSGGVTVQSLSNAGVGGVVHTSSAGVFSSSKIVESDITAGTITNTSISASAAIAGTKISPNFGAQNVSTSGSLSAGSTTATALTVSGLSTGIAHVGSGGAFTSSLIVDADVSSSAAIDGTKVVPAFGAQNVSTSGTVTFSGLSTAGLVHNSSAGLLSTSLLVDADVAANAAIAGTKISPDFGSQSVTTSGAISITGGSNGFSVAKASGGSLALNADGTISGLVDGAAADTAVTKGYVDGLVQGLNIKGACLVATSANITLSGTQTIDGVAVGVSDRVLVKSQTNAAENGIYVVASGAWSRAADMNSWAEVPGAFTFIEEGSTYADTGWVCTSDPGGTLGTTAINFTQFSAAGVYSFGAGLETNGTLITVKAGDGIETSSNGSATNVKLAASDPALQFVSGGLGVALNATDPGLSVSGGLKIALNPSTDPALSTVGGLAVTLDGSTLAKTGSGLKVVGLPSQFEINGSAVSSSVTAANVDTLVAGVSSNAGDASALHAHDSACVYVTADGGLAAGEPVIVSDANKAKKALAYNANDGWIVGVSAGTVSDGNAARIITSGVVTGVNPASTNAGDVLYLAHSGGLTKYYSAIDPGDRVIMVGVAKNSTDLIVQIRDFGQKAA